MLSRLTLLRSSGCLAPFAQQGSRCFADLNADKMTDKVKEAANTVTEKVSNAMSGAKDFVKEAADRVSYDQEGYHAAKQRHGEKADAIGNEMDGSALDAAGIDAGVAKPLAEAAAGKADEHLGMRPSGTAPLTEKGPHILKDRDGQTASCT